MLVGSQDRVGRIVKSGILGEEELNCLSAYYEAQELLQGDPEKWIVNRIRELYKCQASPK
jgi:hypothetical protein